MTKKSLHLLIIRLCQKQNFVEVQVKINTGIIVFNHYHK